MRQFCVLNLLTFGPKPREVFRARGLELSLDERFGRLALGEMVLLLLVSQHIGNNVIPSLSLHVADKGRIGICSGWRDTISKLILDVHDVGEEHSDEGHTWTVSDQKCAISGETSSWFVVLE
jgi:hypothetical protein